jgi:hypothetical protein
MEMIYSFPPTFSSTVRTCPDPTIKLNLLSTSIIFLQGKNRPDPTILLQLFAKARTAQILPNN